MKRIVCLTATAIALALAAPAYAQTAAAPAARTSSPMMQQGHKEHHPELQHAMHALENAKVALEKGSHDFGGHRVKALEHVNAAIGEVKQAMESDQH